MYSFWKRRVGTWDHNNNCSYSNPVQYRIIQQVTVRLALNKYSVYRKIICIFNIIFFKQIRNVRDRYVQMLSVSWAQTLLAH